MTRTIVALGILALAISGAMLANLLGLSHPADTAGISYSAASAEHWLGTDHLGRDVARAVIRGGQSLLLTALVAGTATTILGTVIGCWGVLHPKAGIVIEALADATVLIPTIIVLMLASVLFPDAGLGLLATIAALLGTPAAARVIASAAYPVVHSGYVQAARGTGASDVSILARDIVPHISGVIRSVWGLRIVEALYIFAVASFIGITSSLGEFAWSTMVRDNAAGIVLNPWAVLAPAALLAIVSIAIMAVLHPRAVV